MELDWYTEKLSPYAVLTPTSSSRWMSNFGDTADRQGSPRWLSFRSMMQDRKVLLNELSPPGSNVSSPKKLRDPQRSLSGGDAKFSVGSPSSSLSPSGSKSHVCFGCVLHSHPE